MRPSVIMIHGMWGTGEVWTHMATYFRERGWTVHTPTLPHHGPNADRTALGKTGLTTYVDHIVALAQQQESPPVLIGHSMGGLIAQMASVRTKTAAVVLFNAAAPHGVFLIRPVMLPGVWRFFARPFFWKRSFKPWRYEANYCLFNRVPKADREALHKGMVHESGRAGSELALWFLDRNKTSVVNPEDLTCPVLFFAAEKDRITPLSVCRKVAARYGDKVEYRELPNRGHWLPSEPGWQRLAGRIDHWLHQSLNIPEQIEETAADAPVPIEMIAHEEEHPMVIGAYDHTNCQQLTKKKRCARIKSSNSFPETPDFQSSQHHKIQKI